MTTKRTQDYFLGQRLKWLNKNWKELNISNKRVLDRIYKKSQLPTLWLSLLESANSNEMFIREIFFDSQLSVLFAIEGLYKYAYVALRSELENLLKCVYFVYHPVEYEWWREGDEWYTQDRGNVWGNNYQYFEHLKTIKQYHGEIKNKGSGDLISEYKSLYRVLSKYVHTGVFSRQTTQNKLAPTFRVSEFNKWKDKYNLAQEFITIFLIVNFRENYKKLRITEKKKLLDIGIESRNRKAQIRGMP
jgi:hypothetical protein